ncbi:hypothetical protein GCM10027592_08290 [Spirosoma flavus]
MKKAFTLLFCLTTLSVLAQSGGKISFRYDQTPTVTVNGRTLLNPWAGGLNATQYSTMRLNDDNRDDLVVFDRMTSKVSTFVAIDNPTGTGTAWRHAPEYEAAFPAKLSSWLLLVDYDQDGRKDLFTYRSGVRLFHNDSQNGQVKFTLVADPIQTEGFSGRQSLFVASTDIPAITDFDDDGDIDIITFDSGGNVVSYQQNMSVERTGKKDGLDFKRNGGLCWGHFQKEYCNDFVFGIQCDQDLSIAEPKIAVKKPSGARPMHTGNTLTVIDTDGDGNKDLLFGFVSCENVARLRSGGPNNAKVDYTSYDSLYPAQNPIAFPAFPATFWEDVDGDGTKDLLASPNVSLNDGLVFDFRSSGWFYKNKGTNQKPDFQLVQKDFLQNDMLDLGERAAPALADLDGDGDLDMLVGYGGVGVGKDYKASLWHFENKGTLQNPAFVLVTTDYLGLSKSLAFSNTVPSFTDVDNNGSMDLVLTYLMAGEVNVRVFFNAAAKGAPAQYDLAKAVRWPVPDIMIAGDLLTITDVDRDGKPDALISSSAFGTIQYYRNTGTATAPTLQLQNQKFGGIATDDYIYAKARSLAVVDVNGDQKNELIAAADNGTVYVYQFPEPITQSFVLLDSLPAIGNPGSGLIAATADLDGDQLPDLMLGSTGGGLRYLKNTSQRVVTSTGPVEEPIGPWAFPNPTDRYLTIRAPHDGRIELLSISGQRMLEGQSIQAGVETTIDLGNLPDATYLLRLVSDNRAPMVQKVVVWK